MSGKRNPNNFVTIVFYWLFNPLCIAGESISTDTIRNCMKMLEKQNYIEVAHISGIRHISLNKKYESSGRVSEIIERIESVITF